MSHHLIVAFGVIGGVLQIAGAVPYIIDIFKHKTKPERATWWIWILLNMIAIGAQFGAHATWSLLMSLGQFLVTATVAVLSLRYGYGRFHRKDLGAVICALLGLGLWWWLSNPLAALVVVVVIDFIGFWLTIEKAYKAPQTETLSTWVISTFAGVFGALAVNALTVQQLLYPAYIMLGNLALVCVIVWRRGKTGKDADIII